MRELAARGLEHARARTATLTEFDDTELITQHSPLMSPLVWDLAHIGQQEDLWLLRGGDASAQGVLPCAVEQLYDAFEHPRAERVALPLLTPDRGARLPRRRPRPGVRRAGAHARGPRRAVPVRDGRAARAAAHRDDARDPPAARRRADPRSRDAVAARPARSRTTRCAYRPASSCWAWTARTSPGRWTTSGPRTSSTCPLSRSAGYR